MRKIIAKLFNFLVDVLREEIDKERESERYRVREKRKREGEKGEKVAKFSKTFSFWKLG